MHGGLSHDRKVRLSDKHMNCDKTKEICEDIFISHQRPFILVFWQEEWLVGDDPCYLKF